MKTDFILPTVNWLNVNLYSEKELTNDDQIKALDLIRDNLRQEIPSKIKDLYYCSMELTLFGDTDNKNFHRLVVNVVAIPKKSFLPAGFNFQQELAGFGRPTEDASTGSANPPVIPPHPKGQAKHIFVNTGFTPILQNMSINQVIGAFF